MATVRVRPLASASDARAFLDLPRALYPPSSPWVEPLRFDQAKLLDQKRHPFYEGGRSAEAAFFLAWDAGGKPVGRIAAIVNHQHSRYVEERTGQPDATGFFGFFECVDDVDVARALVDAAAAWLRARGRTTMVGPASPSHNYEYGLLVEGFDRPHRFLLSYHLPYYQRLIEACGLAKERDLLAFSYDLTDPTLVAAVDAEARRFERIWQERYGDVVVRPLNLRRLGEEIRRGVDLINRSLLRNWGFAPMTESELAEMAATVRYVIDPELVLFAERQGESVGIALTMPDLNEAIRRVRFRSGVLEMVEFLLRVKTSAISAARIIALGVVQDRREFGIGPLLLLQTFRNLQKRGIKTADASWVLEDNEEMLRPLRRWGVPPDRIYRLYSMTL